MTSGIDPLVEGKTKKIRLSTEGNTLVVVESKNDITAGDGEKHDTVEGKGDLANATTCNVFQLLKSCGTPAAFERRINSNSFLAPRCNMIPLEVIIRREARGSFLKRKPFLTTGTVFPKLVFELFLKTTDKKFRDGREFPWDDPFMRWTEGEEEESGDFVLLPPKGLPDPEDQKLFVNFEDIFGSGNGSQLLVEIEDIARRTFLILEKAWQILGRRLVDFKLEFGIAVGTGELLLADVVDNDSWRLMDGEKHLDKQLYRDGSTLSEVTDRYQLVARLTEQFRIPRQRVVIWTGSPRDDIKVFETALGPYKDFLEVEPVVCSMHKEPEQGLSILRGLVQEIPDTVVIAYVGMSNGAGPTLSAHTGVPVITVPNGFEKLPQDVWSSLRGPSSVPCMTVLSPKNAVLAALQILALRSPKLYATIQKEQEERFTNFVPLET